MDPGLLASIISFNFITQSEGFLVFQSEHQPGQSSKGFQGKMTVWRWYLVEIMGLMLLIFLEGLGMLLHAHKRSFLPLLVVIYWS